MSIVCKTLVLGATFFGLSAAMRNAQDSIVIERGFSIGSEYVDSFHVHKKTDIPTCSELGAIYKRELLDNGFLNADGDIYSAHALYLLCDRFYRSRCRIFLGTEIISISPKNGGYTVTCFHSRGYFEVEATEIIDTTAEGVLQKDMPKTEKYLNAMVSGECSGLDGFMWNGITKLYTLSFKVAHRDDLFAARGKLYAFWDKAPWRGRDVTLLITANTFSYRMPYFKKVLAQRYTWIPSVCFDNLLLAVDKGQIEQYE